MESKNLRRQVLTIPNLLSLVRIALIPVILWLYRDRQEPAAAGIVLILSGVTDVVDGFIARKFNMISDLGKVLDPIADKLTQAAVLVSLVLSYPGMLWSFLMLAAKELFMAVTGFLVIRRKGKVMGACWHGKAATFLLYAMMMIHLFWPELPRGLSDALIGASVAMTGLSFLLYGVRNLGELRGEPGKA